MCKKNGFSQLLDNAIMGGGDLIKFRIPHLNDQT